MAVAITKRRFTADDYHRMGETGILSARDRVELIDGEVVTVSPVGSRHAAIVNRATRLLVTRLGDHAIVQAQGPVRLDRFNEPQPDIVVLRPRDDFYVTRYPGPDDVLLVLEVSDSSPAYDREVKGPLYAAAGISEYWIADVAAHRLECYTNPAAALYRTLHHATPQDSVTPTLLSELVVTVGELLGP
jgi:Uma2 family endonuclease